MSAWLAIVNPNVQRSLHHIAAETLLVDHLKVQAVAEKLEDA